MKVYALLGALILTGCGSTATLEQLEEQAFLSGDWSAVEKRERIIARRDARRGPQCPSRFTAYCEAGFGVKRCRCVDTDALREALFWE